MSVSPTPCGEGSPTIVAHAAGVTPHTAAVAQPGRISSRRRSSARVSHSSSIRSRSARRSAQLGVQLGDLRVVGGVLGQLLVQRGLALLELAELPLQPGQLLARPRATSAARTRRLGGAAPAGRPVAGSAPAPAAAGRAGGPGEVLVDAAGQVHQPAVAEHAVHRVGDPLDQVPVVAGHDHRAGPGVEQVLQRGQGVGVQVVGRLVEQQHVGLAGEQPQHLQPAPLAAGQVARPASRAGASVKPNTSASWAADSSRSPSLTRLATSSTASSTRRCAGQLGELLGQERRPHRRAACRPGRRRGRVTPASSRSRVVLPAPLAPTMAIRSPGPTSQSTSVEQGSGRRRAASTSASSYTCLPSRAVASRCSDTVSRAGGTSAISALAASMRNFGLRGAGRRAAAQPGDLLAEQVLPAGLGGGRDPLPLGPGQGPGGEAALVGAHGLVGDLPGAGADRVEEPPVVGDHDQRARAGRAGAGPASRRRRRRGGWSARRGSAGRSARTSSAASATRRRSPPDIGPTGASRPRCGMPSPSRTVRTPASPAHSCSAANPAGSQAVPSTTSRTVAVGGEVERLRQRRRPAGRAGG